MKPITKYQAEDSTEFPSREACLVYERMCADVQEIMSKLPKKPDLPACGFENGGGYIQHDIETVLAVRRAILEKAAPYCTYVDWVTKAIDDIGIDSSWPARIISEACPIPLYRAWHRFMCMDKQWREWGQPFYAHNPEKATQQRLN